MRSEWSEPYTVDLSDIYIIKKEIFEDTYEEEGALGEPVEVKE